MRSGDEASAKMEGVDGDDRAQGSRSVESDDGDGMRPMMRVIR